MNFRLTPELAIDIADAPPEIGSLFEAELFVDDSPQDAPNLVSIVHHDRVGQRLQETLGGTASISDDGKLLFADRSGRLMELELEIRATGGFVATLRLGNQRPSALTVLNSVIVPLSLIASRHDFAPLHASGFQVHGGPVIVASAWSGVGKTNSVLEARRRGMSRFLGDDMVLVDAHSNGLSSPRRISAFTYNYELLEESEKMGGVKPFIGSTLNRLLNRSKRGRANMLGKIVVSRLGHTPVMARTGDESELVAVDRHVLLRGTGLGHTLTSCGSEPDDKELAMKHALLAQHEYSATTRMAAAAAWVGHPFGGLWADTMDNWPRILESYFGGVPDVRRVDVSPGGYYLEDLMPDARPT